MLLVLKDIKEHKALRVRKAHRAYLDLQVLKEQLVFKALRELGDPRDHKEFKEHRD